ncbi:MAG: LPS export ABC transporter permease LptG [Bdellovibrionaceae bacterium]|nr:LPS export ABC transporter permease LptG [Pseudobdellovibrionaceae bacterium]
MNRIDRYNLGLFWLFFIGSLAIFATVFMAIDAMSTMVSNEGIEMTTLIRYYAYTLPEIIYRMIPVAGVMATIFTLSSLQRAGELIALFSLGMSLTRVTIPLVLSVLLMSGVSLFLSDQVLPGMARMKNYVYYHEIRKNPSLYSMVKTNRIWYRSKDTIFNLKTLNEQAHKAQGLTLYYFNEDWNLIQMITASEVDLLQSTWKLRNGSVTVFTEESSFPMTSDFKEKTISMGEDAKDLSSTANTSDVLSLRELNQFIKKNKEAGLDTLRYEVDYHSKYGFAIAGLVMVLLGIPFSVGKARSGGLMANLGVCLGLVFAYWILYSSALTLGYHGSLPPIVAAWAPNLFMGAFGLIMIKRQKK